MNDTQIRTVVNLSSRWLRRKGSSVCHTVMTRTGAHVEFWCGQEADDPELRLPTERTHPCQRCHDFLLHSKTHPAQTVKVNR